MGERNCEGLHERSRYIHDGFGSFTERAAPALLRILPDSGARSGLVVGVGCGSALWGIGCWEQGYHNRLERNICTSAGYRGLVVL